MSQVNKKNISKCYYSKDGGYIYDAITNAQFPWKVGSLNERQFFKVISHKNNENNFEYTKYAFYESPDAYMEHCNIELEQSIIDNWIENRKLYLKKD